jgi:aspartyl-tRNA(Asn)/glutamyl-tRNA(Gln) amidotransferase subunit B
MRGKEEAADYRYFPDPDIPPLHIDNAWISKVKTELPELPNQRYQRYLTSGLTPYEADVLINDIEVANYYDKAITFTKSPSLINWVLRELMAFIKEEKITLAECKITPELLAQLVTLLDNKVINNRAAQEVFEVVAKTGQSPQTVVKERGLEQMGSSEELEKIIKEIIDANPHNVAEYKSGKTKLWGFFVGQAMQKTKGNGNPQIINDLLKKYLS